MAVAAASPVLWPFAGTDALLNMSLIICMLALLALLPLGWIAIRRRFGLTISGPLWPLLFFQIVATFYAFMTPPWLMPDEPQHMMYAELVRRGGTELTQQLATGRFPENEAALLESLDAYRSVLRSARQSEMGRWLPGADAELAKEQLPGVSELGHPPMYYVVASGLTAPFADADVRGRLALLRVFGVMLTGWAVWLCGAAGRMLWPTRRRLAEAPLALAAGLPTLATFAGAVNNDAMANLVGALIIVLIAAAATGWMGRRPWLWTAGLATAVVAALATKRTLLPLLLAVPIALLLRHALTLRRALMLVIVTQLSVAALTLGLPVRGLAVWEQGTERDYRCTGGVVGERSLCMEPSRSTGVQQFTSLAAFNELAGRTASLGMWVRGPVDDQLRVTIGEGVGVQRYVLPVEPEWRFRVLQFVRPRAGQQLSVGFLGASRGRLEIDGVVLAPGRFSDRPPVYGADGRQVVWDGRVVTNRLYNGSAEEALRRAPSWLPKYVQRTLNDAMAQADRIVRLWPETTRSLDLVWERIVQTFGMFWATAGWEVPPLLLPGALLVALAVLVATGWLGTVMQLVRPKDGPRTPAVRRGVGALTICLLVACTAIVLRGIPPDRVLVVSGRYLFSVLVAVTTVMVVGWRRLWPGDDRSFRNAIRWLALGTHSVFITILFIPFVAR